MATPTNYELSGDGIRIEYRTIQSGPPIKNEQPPFVTYQDGKGIALSFNGAQVQTVATEAGQVVSVVIVEPPNDLEQTVTVSFLIPRVQLADERNSSAKVQTLGITTKHHGVNPGGPINGVNEQLDTYSPVTMKGTASQMRIHAETSA